MNVLFVTTNCSSLAPEHPTGTWLEEFAVPYMRLAEAGASITVASPRGGATPIDPKTLPKESERAKWAPALRALETTVPLRTVQAHDFDGIFLPGGHGPLVDLTRDPDLARLVPELDRAGKVIAAVCHGPAGLLNVANGRGEPLLRGRKATGFTNMEERLAFLHDVVPFLLEHAMKERGARFESGLLPLVSHVVRDGNLITGQNPGSSAKVAETLLEALAEGPRAATAHAATA